MGTDYEEVKVGAARPALASAAATPLVPLRPLATSKRALSSESQNQVSESQFLSTFLKKVVIYLRNVYFGPFRAFCLASTPFGAVDNSQTDSM